MERYGRELVKIVTERIEAATAIVRQDILELRIENSRRLMNANTPGLTLIIGAGRRWQTRQMDTIGESNIANAMAENTGFSGPSVPNEHRQRPLKMLIRI